MERIDDLRTGNVVEDVGNPLRHVERRKELLGIPFRGSEERTNASFSRGEKRRQRNGAIKAP